MQVADVMVTRIFGTLVLLFLICSTSTFATSVQEVSLGEMLDKSRFVFEGRVVDTQVRENPEGLIQTYVTFKIKDIIKGEYSSDGITLSFLGGTVGVMTSAISGMQFPVKNEHGIYFVESIEIAQVHPFYGWSQGHFLVEQDITGVDRVMTNRRIPVTKVMHGSSTATRGLSSGVARGIVTSKNMQLNEAVTAQEFKESLLEMVRNQ